MIDVEPRPQQDPYDFIPGHRRPAFSIHHLRALLQCGSKTGGRGRGKEREKKILAAQQRSSPLIPTATLISRQSGQRILHVARWGARGPQFLR